MRHILKLMLGTGAITLLTGPSLLPQSGQPSLGQVQAAEEVPAERQIQARSPASAAEARGRARLLHETIHGALQVMHRDFFREDEGLVIPSHSLEDVFHELARSHQVEVRWLVVNADAMNIDNLPRTAFEKQAVKELSAGKPEFESVVGQSYHFAGAIRLSSQCLKCHVPRRTDTKDRTAGLVISMPIGTDP